MECIYSLKSYNLGLSSDYLLLCFANHLMFLCVLICKMRNKTSSIMSLWGLCAKALNTQYIANKYYWRYDSRVLMEPSNIHVGMRWELRLGPLERAPNLLRCQHKHFWKWSYSHSSLSFIPSLLPESVGRERKKEKPESWFGFGCKPSSQ